MIFFKNTVGGEYALSEYGQKSVYTFPAEACINLDGVELKISGISLACFGGEMPGVATEYFTKTVSKIPSSSPDIINTSIFINDNRLGYGYPGRDVFQKYEIAYINSKDFISLQEAAEYLPSHHPDFLRHRKIVCFLNQWVNDSQIEMKKQIDSALSQNKSYPKRLSMIYDNRMQKHTTHIVLEYTSKNECVLKIDNTLSFAGSPSTEKCKEDFKSKYNIDVDTDKESFSNDNPYLLKFHNKNKSAGVGLGLIKPISQILFEKFYSRMASVLKEKLQIPIKNVIVNSSPLNQKLTNECVSFSIQNKIDFVTKNISDTNESVYESALRIKAEQAIMAYLLNGKSEIPLYSKEECVDSGATFRGDKWYPNYSEVCQELNNRLSQLSVESLERLLLSMDLGDGISLAYSLRSFILDSLKAKVDLSNYEELPIDLISEDQAKELEIILAPSLIYQNYTFFLKKGQEFNALRDYLIKTYPKYLINLDYGFVDISL